MIVAPATVQVVHSVVEVDRHLIEWDGRVVKVRGWVNPCGAGRATGPAISSAKQCVGRGDLPISISRRLFEAIKGKAVVLRARIDATCRKRRCADRYSELQVEGVDTISAALTNRSH